MSYPIVNVWQSSESVVSLVDLNKMFEDIICPICHDVLFRSDSEELIKCTQDVKPHIFDCECLFSWFCENVLPVQNAEFNLGVKFKSI